MVPCKWNQNSSAMWILVRVTRLIWLFSGPAICLDTVNRTADYLCPINVDQNCTCTQIGIEEEVGWIITYFHGKPEKDNILYQLEYVYNTVYTVKCSLGYQPLVEDFLWSYRGHVRNQVSHFELYSCSLALNITISQVFNGYDVQKLLARCDGCAPNASITPRIFQNLRHLEELTLEKYNLTVLPEDMFADLTNLKYLTLDNNEISNISGTVFANLGELVELSLYGNQIEVLRGDTFTQLTRLKKLDLSSNHLKTIEGDVFFPLSSLNTLGLHNNDITVLKAGAFQNNIELQVLYLFKNRITGSEISTEAFGNNTSMVCLDLSYNELSNISESVSQILPGLRELNISKNNLVALPGNLLFRARNLTTLKISNNQISNIPPQLFCNTVSLEYLSLENNRIDSLPGGVFEKTVNLKYLSLACNVFTTFPVQQLIYLQKLEVLDFRGNRLKELESMIGLPSLTDIDLTNNLISSLQNNEPFGMGNNLRNVNLSHNLLETFPELDWRKYPNLNYLDLSYNRILFLDIPTMNSFPGDINLEFNNITGVSVLGVEYVDNSVGPISHSAPVVGQFHLLGNPFDCDCHLLEFQRYMKTRRRKIARFLNHTQLVCSSPRKLRNVSILNVKEEDFVCSIEDQCEQGCSCLIRTATNCTEVDCRNRGMKDLPSVAPKNTSVLRFSNNSLTSMRALKDPLWKDLEELHVENNKITTNELYLPEKLKQLYIDGNSLTILPDSLAEWIRGAQNVTLQNNPWTCDCQGLTLKRLLTAKYTIIPDQYEIVCATPVSLAGKIVLNLRERDMCPDKRRNVTTYIVIICVCVCLGLTTVVLCVLYYRNRKVIIAYIYIHYYKIFAVLFKENDLDEDKPFHAFVSYSSVDSQLVRTLVDELEKKEPSFRLCIHERDWLPGQLITWNIVRSVQNSRRTILVLSKDFLKSIWFQLEFHIAYYQMLEDNVDRLIVIINGELPPKEDLDEDIRVLLCTKSYLIWGERWFWEKLKFALPHKTSASPDRPGIEQPSHELLNKIENKILTLTKESIQTPTQDGSGQECIELTDLTASSKV